MKKSFIALFLMFVSVVSMAETSQGENFSSTSNDDNIARAEAGGEIIASGSIKGYTWTLDAMGNFVMSGEDENSGALNFIPWTYGDKIKNIKFKGKIRFSGDCTKMFANLNELISVDFGNVNTTEVTSMNSMFANCRKLLTVNVSSFDTSNVRDMRSMFAECRNLVFVDITNFNISNLNTYVGYGMDYMFQNCKSLIEMDLSGIRRTEFVRARNMFDGCSRLARIDITDFFTDRGTDFNGFFNGCNNLKTIICDTEDRIPYLEGYNPIREHCNTSNAKVYVPPTRDNIYRSYWSMYSDKILQNEIVYEMNGAKLDVTGRVKICYDYNSRLGDDFWNYDSDIKTVKFQRSGSSYDDRPIQVSSFYALFANLRNLKTVYWGNIVTSQRTTMNSMFRNCECLVCFNMPYIDTSQIDDVSFMFEGCQNLIAVNMSNFNSNVNSMASMFSGCKSIVSLNISNINTSKVLTMNSMFANCGTSGYRSYAGEYYNPIPTFDLSNFDTSNVESMSWMFYGCSGLKSLDLSNLNTSRVTDMSYMFYGCTGLTYLDLSNFDTSYVSSMSNMFKNCNNLKTLTLDRFYVPDNSNGMFDGDNIENIIFKSIPRVADGSFNSLQDTKVTLNLTDASYIHEGPNNFPSVYKATYTRPVTNKWGTIVLPFNVRMGETYDFYQVNNIKNDNLNLKKISALPAGTPAIFCVNDGETKLTITSSDVDVSTELNTEPAGELTLVGTFSELDLTYREGFIIANDKFWNIQDIRGDNWVGIKPFRAYLAGSLSSGAHSLGISFDDTEDVDAVEAISDVENGEMEYYDLNGRRLNGLKNGVNIVKLANGQTKKIIVE